jgi:oxygen-dependent protoporphyrinogen oxidase
LPPNTIRYQTSADTIRGTGPFAVTTASGETYESRAVIVAAPAWAAAPMLDAIEPAVGRLVREIRYLSSATVAIALCRDQVHHDLQGSGFVVPRADRTALMAGSWVSSKWPHRAPAGHVLLRGFVGGAYDEAILQRTDGEITQAVLRDFDALLDISGEPLLTRVYRWERANAQHDVGHDDRMKEIDRRLSAIPGLFVTGSGFRGSGIPDCVADARRTAAAAAERLNQCE